MKVCCCALLILCLVVIAQGKSIPDVIQDLTTKIVDSQQQLVQ